jgi:TPR repeat protein
MMLEFSRYQVYRLGLLSYDADGNARKENEIMPSYSNTVAARSVAISVALLLGFQLPSQVAGAEDSYDCGKLNKTTAEAQAGDSTAQYQLGMINFFGKCGIANTGGGLRWFSRAAALGNVKAEVALAGIYRETGNGTQALNWARLAADEGDSGGEAVLAELYHSGLGVSKDDTEAAKWARKSAEQNDPSGEALLGWLAVEGKGVPKDDAEAAKWARKSAEQNDPFGEFVLGWLYLVGKGVPEDDAEAAKWARKAAIQGNADGEAFLGWRYYDGKGLPKDDAEAAKWSRRAADQGNHGGQQLLGLMYSTGQGGLPKDTIFADMWFILSYRDTNGTGGPMGKLESSMSTTDIAKAHRLADAWKPNLKPTRYSADD